MSVSGEERLAGESFEDVEQAVKETQRGRWFLEEHAKRSKVGDTSAILQAIRKLEASVTRPQAETGVVGLISAARREIASIRNDKLPDGGVITVETAAFDRLAVQAREAVGALGARIEDLQDTLAKLKQSGLHDDRLAELSGIAKSLETVGLNQDLVARRVAKLTNLLNEICTNSVAEAVKTAEPPVAPHQMKYFKADEEIFERPAAPKLVPTPAPMPVAAKPASLPPPPKIEEPKGARLVIRRVSLEESQLNESPAAPPPAAPIIDIPPDPEAVASNPRIVVVTPPSSEGMQIPFAEGTAA
jgi:hypothetical protein